MSPKPPCRKVDSFEPIGEVCLRILQRLMPNGTLRGAEYQARNPTRNDHSKGSFSYNIKKNTWADFATGDKGRGVISLCAYLDKSSYRDAAGKIKRLSGESDFPVRAYADVKIAKPANVQRNGCVERLWRQTIPASGTIVESYLIGRGLNCTIPNTIRFLPRCYHAEAGTYLPAMIAAVTVWPTGKIIALHRTFLKSDGTGKAEVDPSKKMLGSVSGGALRLAAPTDKLILAEGIETAMSLWVATGLPAWAALSAGGYINLILPEKPLAREIIIGADHDEAGLRAARCVAEKWSSEGRKVLIAVPNPNEDFNDVLRRL